MRTKKLSYLYKIVIALTLLMLSVETVSGVTVQDMNGTKKGSGNIINHRVCESIMAIQRSESEGEAVVRRIVDQEGLNGIRKNGTGVSSFLVCALIAAQLFLASGYVDRSFFNSDHTKRFSVISYLHHSDGKKHP